MTKLPKLKHEYKAPERSGSVYQSPSRKPLTKEAKELQMENRRRQSDSTMFDSNEPPAKLFEKLQSLATADYAAIGEIITGLYYLATGIEKERTMSGFGSLAPGQTPPGHTLMADLANKVSRDLDGKKHNWRQERYRRRQELLKYALWLQQEMARLESFDDPERRAERIIKEANLSHAPKPLCQKA